MGDRAGLGRLCAHCRRQPAVRRTGTCDTCYRYERRAGLPRPVEVIARHAHREIERDLRP